MESAPRVWNALTKGSYCKTCPKAADACILRGRLGSNVNLTFVLETPSHDTVRTRTPLNDRPGAVLTTIWKEVCRQLGTQLSYNVTYAVGAPHAKEPKKETSQACNNYLRAKLVSLTDDRHQVIVAFGKSALKALGVTTSSIKSARGHLVTSTIAGRPFYIMPTLGISHIVSDPGVFRVVVNDLVTAAKLAFSNDELIRPDPATITKLYRLPTTVEEVEKLVDEVIAYTDAAKQPDPDKWPISLDTETTSLYAHDPLSKMIAVSVAWDNGKSGTIYLDHKDSPYAGDRSRVVAALTKLFGCNKPKIFHNAKFDLKFITHKYGFVVKNLWWDTLLAEHFLDEDKSGYYGLKTIAAIYTPALLGYEDALKKSLIASGHTEESIRFSDLNPSKKTKRMPQVIEYNYMRTDIRGVLNVLELQTFEAMEHKYVDLALNGDAGRTKIRNSMRRMLDKAGGKGIKMSPAVRKRVEATKVRTFEDVPLEIMATYAAADTDITRRVCRQQRIMAGVQGSLSDLSYIMETFYIRGTIALAAMEHAGTRVNMDAVSTYETEITALAEKSLDALRNILCDDTFNPNSGDQLYKKITTALLIPESEITFSPETGKPKFTAAILKKFQAQYAGNKTQRDFFYWLLAYKASSKALTSFIKKFREMSKLDGRIHGSFHLNGTATGRLASAAPNLQNIPLFMCAIKDKEPGRAIPGWNIKALFGPSDPSKAFFQLDISAAEIRVLAAYSADPLLIDALRQGLDIHSFVASQVGELTYEEIEARKDSDPEVKLFRTACKRIVFGTLYGAGPRKIAEQIYGELSSDPTECESQIAFAKATMAKIFNKFTGIPKHIDRVKASVTKDRHCRSILGRRRRFPMFDAGSEYSSAAKREGVNFQIQSTASDLVLDALAKASTKIKDIGGEILLTVHDSIAGEIDIDKIGLLNDFWTENLVEHVRATYPWMPVDYKFDLEFGTSYGELISIDALTKPTDTLSSKEKKILTKLGMLLEVG